MEDGIRRMMGECENAFYYITLYTENYLSPALPSGVEEGIRRGMYRLRQSALEENQPRVQLLGSGSILREVLAAADRLENDFGVGANVWSATSFGELRRDGIGCDRWNLLHPGVSQRVPYVTEQLSARPGSVVAASDFMKNYADQIRALHPQRPRLPCTRHRRLRPQRLPQQAARALRGEPPLHRGRRAQVAGRRGHRPGGQGGGRDCALRHRHRQGQPAIRRTTSRRQTMALVEVQVPDIGDFKDVEIIELLVKPGDPVAVDQSLLTVESDKASMEIPSTHAGVVQEMKVRVGDKVSQGSAVLVLETAAGAASAAAALLPVGRRAAHRPGGGACADAGARRRPLQPAAAAGSGAPIQVEVPDIGDFDEVAVIEVFVKPGDTVKVEQSLITVESDKASMEIPSHAGVVDKVLAW